MAAAVLNIPRAILQTPSEESGLPVAPTGPREFTGTLPLPFPVGCMRWFADSIAGVTATFRSLATYA